jgi:hypothetical protein
MIAMHTHRIIPASALRPGLATVVVALPDRTIRSVALMVQVHARGVVQVAFASGDVLTLMPRTAVGLIERRPARARQRAS